MDPSIVGDEARPHRSRPGGGSPRAEDRAGGVRRGRGRAGANLDSFEVPEREKGEVLAAFAAHKGEVTQGYSP